MTLRFQSDAPFESLRDLREPLRARRVFAISNRAQVNSKEPPCIPHRCQVLQVKIREAVGADTRQQ